MHFTVHKQLVTVFFTCIPVKQIIIITSTCQRFIPFVPALAQTLKNCYVLNYQRKTHTNRNNRLALLHCLLLISLELVLFFIHSITISAIKICLFFMCCKISVLFSIADIISLHDSLKGQCICIEAMQLCMISQPVKSLM